MIYITNRVPRHVYIIWCMNGRFRKIIEWLQPFGATLKYIAIGIDNITPQIDALFVAFFPKLVAGPIIRANEFLPQIHDKIKYKSENIFYIPINSLLNVGNPKKFKSFYWNLSKFSEF